MSCISQGKVYYLGIGSFTSLLLSIKHTMHLEYISSQSREQTGTGLCTIMIYHYQTHAEEGTHYLSKLWISRTNCYQQSDAVFKLSFYCSFDQYTPFCVALKNHSFGGSWLVVKSLTSISSRVRLEGQHSKPKDTIMKKQRKLDGKLVSDCL